MNKREYWSQKEIEYVTSNAYCKTYKELAKDLNRTKLSMERKMHRSGIKPLLWVAMA